MAVGWAPWFSSMSLSSSSRQAHFMTTEESSEKEKVLRVYAECSFCLTLQTKARHKASLESRSRDTDSIPR